MSETRFVLGEIAIQSPSKKGCNHSLWKPQMTLADIAAYIGVPLLNIDGNVISKETHPNLFALHEKLSKNEIFESEAKRYPPMS